MILPHRLQSVESANACEWHHLAQCGLPCKLPARSMYHEGNARVAVAHHAQPKMLGASSIAEDDGQVSGSSSQAVDVPTTSRVTAGQRKRGRPRKPDPEDELPPDATEEERAMAREVAQRRERNRRSAKKSRLKAQAALAAAHDELNFLRVQNQELRMRIRALQAQVNVLMSVPGVLAQQPASLATPLPHPRMPWYSPQLPSRAPLNQSWLGANQRASGNAWSVPGWPVASAAAAAEQPRLPPQ